MIRLQQLSEFMRDRPLAFEIGVSIAVAFGVAIFLVLWL